MRIKHAVLILMAGFLIGPTILWSQGPSGRGSGGRFGGPFDPNAFFDRMAKGKDVIVRSELEPWAQGMFDRWAGQLNITNGQITRDQYQQVMQQMAQMGPPGGGRSGGPRSGGPPSATPLPGGAIGGQPMAITISPNGSGPVPFPAAPQGAPAISDQQAEFLFNRADRDKDGYLSYEEMSDRLKEERDKWDTNHDGFIDINEYKVYLAARFGQNSDNQSGQPGSPNGGTNQNPVDPFFVPPAAPEEEERRPIVMRAGKLPKELPDWFRELDTDEDGQIGLYEWRRGGRSIEEFEEMDLNGDGLLTPEEYLRFTRVAKEKASKSQSPGLLAAADGWTGLPSFASNDSSPRQTYLIPGSGYGSRGPGGDRSSFGPGSDRGSRGPGGDRMAFGPGGDRPTLGSGGDRPTFGLGGDRPSFVVGGDRQGPGNGERGDRGPRGMRNGGPGADRGPRGPGGGRFQFGPPGQPPGQGTESKKDSGPSSR
jgi:Ca2+-binding EF-hand superfamily protein